MTNVSEGFMETFTGAELIDGGVDYTDISGYPIKADETYVVDHHRGIDLRPEFVTLDGWINSHGDRGWHPGDEVAEKETSVFFDFPKTEKIEFRLRQDLADRLPRGKGERNAFLGAAVEYKLDSLEWQRRAGQTVSAAKSEAARENGKKGGRPRRLLDASASERRGNEAPETDE